MVLMPSTQKVLSLTELASVAQHNRELRKKVVLCHGTFDLLHIGHIRHLAQAKKEGDVLIVTITADEFVNKGPGRPVFTASLRAEHLAALANVDFVGINNEITSVNVINLIKPDVYVKGSDYKVNEEDLTGNIRIEKEAVESHGGKIVYTEDITFSSSRLLNNHFDVFPPQTKNYLNNLKRKYSSDEVIGAIKQAQRLNVLVVGDAIVDEYHYTTAMGQTGKYNVMAVKYRDKERFAGGSIAVANHIAGITDSVTLFTGLGELYSHEEFIKTKLRDNVKTQYYYFKDAPTLVKRRYVDEDNCKLFEVYFYDDHPVDTELEGAACEWLHENIAHYDAVVVPDFGNGFITEAMIKIMCDKARFLAVNTQLNSGNRGYHVIQRYPRADFISLNEPEIRIAAHDRHNELEKVAQQVGGMLDSRFVAITRGKQGIDFYDRDEELRYQVPALSTIVVDRIGAGDAFLAFTGTLLGAGVDARLASFVGSTAAALDVQIVCNREPVDPVSMYKYITTLLK